MENKKSHKKIPIWLWILIAIIGFAFLNPLFIATRNKNNQPEPKLNQEKQTANIEAQNQDFHNKGETLNKEAGNVFINATDTIFLKSHLENVSNSRINLELTVSDVWYDLPKFKQERLMKDACRIFDSLTIKQGLRKEDDMPWQVTFLDSYEKKLAQDNCW